MVGISLTTLHQTSYVADDSLSPYTTSFPATISLGGICGTGLGPGTKNPIFPSKTGPSILTDARQTASNPPPHLDAYAATPFNLPKLATSECIDTTQCFDEPIIPGSKHAKSPSLHIFPLGNVQTWGFCAGGRRSAKITKTKRPLLPHHGQSRPIRPSPPLQTNGPSLQALDITHGSSPECLRWVRSLPLPPAGLTSTTHGSRAPVVQKSHSRLRPPPSKYIAPCSPSSPLPDSILTFGH